MMTGSTVALGGELREVVAGPASSVGRRTADSSMRFMGVVSLRRVTERDLTALQFIRALRRQTGGAGS